MDELEKKIRWHLDLIDLGIAHIISKIKVDAPVYLVEVEDLPIHVEKLRELILEE